MCGLAVHTGYLSNTISIGVAKKFNMAPLLLFGFSKNEIEKIEKVFWFFLIFKKIKQNKII